jgi:uncharacterized protein YciI
VSGPARGEAQPDAGRADPAPLALFAVEVRTGPAWDPSRPPNEQAFFKEHSAGLKRLREAGRIVAGVRYSDVGLLLFSAASVEEVRALMDQDPSMQAGTFRYEVHPANVFYPGTLEAARRPAEAAARPRTAQGPVRGR